MFENIWSVCFLLVSKFQTSLIWFSIKKPLVFHSRFICDNSAAINGLLPLLIDKLQTCIELKKNCFLKSSIFEVFCFLFYEYNIIFFLHHRNYETMYIFCAGSLQVFQAYRYCSITPCSILLAFDFARGVLEEVLDAKIEFISKLFST